MNGLSLSARDLNKSYRTGFLLRVESLEVPAGSTLALLGPSGSGKSTLLSLLGLLERPDAGTILLDGREVSYRDREARLAMAAVFQRPYLIKGSVETNVEYGLKLRHVPVAERGRKVREVLARVGLEGFAERSAITLSGGEAQRVALARALVLEPRVLLLDEPLASLDPLLKRRLTGEFARILRDEGVTVVYVTHDHDEALVVADLIAIMNAGRVTSSGEADAVMSLPADEWTARFLGMEAPLAGRVVRSEDGLVTVEVGGAGGDGADAGGAADRAAVEIVAVGSCAVGAQVMLAVPPEDVTIEIGDAGGLVSSARNRLDGVVEHLEPRGVTWHVGVRCGGVVLASTVSRRAVSDLALAVGVPVRLSFKASAVRVRRV